MTGKNAEAMKYLNTFCDTSKVGTIFNDMLVELMLTTDFINNLDNEKKQDVYTMYNFFKALK